MKAYKDIDEWLDEIEGFGMRRERMHEDFAYIRNPEKWVTEAWKQATRTARVQQQILIGELREVKRQLHELEDQIDDWTMEAKWKDGDD